MIYSTPASKLSVRISRPFESRYSLYLMHFGFSAVSRLCDISFVLFMSSISVNTLLLVALIGFISSLFIFLFMPFVGSLMDSMKRQNGMRWAMLVKVVCLTAAYCCCMYLSLESSQLTSFSALCALYSIPVLVAVNGISSVTIAQSLERDWVVVLANGDSTWLSVTNSVLRQIDLVCVTFANPLGGLLFAVVRPALLFPLLMSANIAVCLVFFSFLRYLYGAWPHLSQRETKEHYYASPIKQRRNRQRQQRGYGSTAAAGAADAEAAVATPQPAVAVAEGEEDRSVLGDFLTSGCAGAMLSSSLLAFTCLNFGSLMVVYLQHDGVTAPIIRLMRGAAAAVGLLGAFLFPHIASWLGLYSTAQLAVCCQATLSVLAALTFLLPNRRVALFVLITLVLNAKTWVFDLAVRQIAQETIHESIRGGVNGQWKALTSLCEMAGFALGILMPDPDQFWLLALLSALSVVLAGLLFTLTNPFGGLHLLHWDIPSIANHPHSSSSSSTSMMWSSAGYLDISSANECDDSSSCCEGWDSSVMLTSQDCTTGSSSCSGTSSSNRGRACSAFGLSSGGDSVMNASCSSCSSSGNSSGSSNASSLSHPHSQFPVYQSLVVSPL